MESRKRVVCCVNGRIRDQRPCILLVLRVGFGMHAISSTSKYYFGDVCCPAGRSNLNLRSDFMRFTRKYSIRILNITIISFPISSTRRLLRSYLDYRR